MKECQQCHRSVEEQVKFCPYCGTGIPPGSGDDRSRDRNSEFVRKSMPVLVSLIVLASLLLLILIPDRGKRELKEPVETPVEEVQDNSSKPAPKNQQAELIRKTRDYYRNLGSGSFDARDYFAPRVIQYYNSQEMDPLKINEHYYQRFLPEFVEPRFRFKEGSFEVIPAGDYFNVRYEGIFTCYRKSKKQYEFARVRAVMQYNEDFRIVSLKEEEIWDIRFTDTRIDS